MADCRVILDFWLRIEDPIESEIPTLQSESVVNLEPPITNSAKRLQSDEVN
jgi:hypothetical protein